MIGPSASVPDPYDTLRSGREESSTGPVASRWTRPGVCWVKLGDVTWGWIQPLWNVTLLRMKADTHQNSDSLKTKDTPEIAYWTAGHTGPKVMLVMGYCMRGDLWKPQIRGLSDAHQLLWYDHRGLGESGPSPRFPWKMKDMSQDAFSVLDAAGWSDGVHLVGVSMGGMIAQEMALAQPERFRSLTLIATHPGGRLGFTIPPFQGLKAFFGSQFRRGDGRLKSLQRILYPPDYAAQTDQEGLAERVRLQLGRPVPLKTRLAHIYAVGLHRTGRRLPELNVPTLILKPGRDILVSSKGSDALEALIPKTEVRYFEDAGHGLIFQCAAEVNHAVAEHVERYEHSDKKS